MKTIGRDQEEERSWKRKKMLTVGETLGKGWVGKIIIF